jgi:hypothetical protein
MAVLQRILTHDGLTLHGIDNNVESDTFVIHVHGKSGNFYQNYFISAMLERYGEAKVRFAAFNHRAHDCLVENYVDGGILYTGAAVEVTTSVQSDVAALHQYAVSQAPRVIMQGHSQGCEYVLWDAIDRQLPAEMVLLSPSDSCAIQQKWRCGEEPLSQARRLRSSSDLSLRNWLSADEYGVRAKIDYEIPVTRGSLVDVLESRQLTTFSFDRPWDIPRVQGRCFAYVGDVDPLRMHSLDQTKSGLSRRVENLSLYSLSDGDHHFHGREQELIGEVIRWIKAG